MKFLKVTKMPRLGTKTKSSVAGHLCNYQKPCNCAFTPKATWAKAATSCHSFPMYADDDGRRRATRFDRLSDAMPEAQLYANERVERVAATQATARDVM